MSHGPYAPDNPNLITRLWRLLAGQPVCKTCGLCHVPDANCPGWAVPTDNGRVFMTYSAGSPGASLTPVTTTQVNLGPTAPVTVTWTGGPVTTNTVRALMGLPSIAHEPTEDSPWHVDKRELVVENLYVLRCFKVDERGRLRPISMTPYFVWRPGENTAVCSYGKDSTFEKEPGHDPAGCTCGFYAYTSHRAYLESHPLIGKRSHDCITGMIKVWGDVLVAEKGLRAEKAEIVGLVAPPYEVQAVYPEVRVFPTVKQLMQGFDFTDDATVAIDDPTFWNLDD